MKTLYFCLLPIIIITIFCQISRAQQVELYPNPALTEENLDGAEITLVLTTKFFDDAILDAQNFILNNAPTGTSVNSVTYINVDSATVFLSFDGTDFDVDFTNFGITVDALEIGGPDQTSGPYTITATNDAESISVAWKTPPGTNGAEATMDNEVITVTIWGGTFITGNIDLVNVTASGTATTTAGVTIESIANITINSFDINLAWDGTDYDVDKTLNIDVPGVAYEDGVVSISGNISLIAYIEVPSATLSATPPLTEGNLNGAQVDIVLTDETFVDPVLLTSNFTLNNAPIGTTVSSVSYINSTTASVDLAFDGTDFDSDFTNFSITISAAELDGVTDLTSNTLTISAINDAESISVAWKTPPGTNGAEATMDNEVITVTISGGTFITGNIDLVNVTASGTATTTAGVTIESIANITINSFDINLAWDGTDYDVDKTLSIIIDPAGYEDGIVSISTDITLVASNEIPWVGISPVTALDELNLNGAQVDINLTDDTFIAPLDIGNFTLNNAPVGTSVNSVTWVTNTYAYVILDFDATDFDTDYTNFSITVSGSELTGGANLTSNGLTITAIIEGAPEVAVTGTIFDQTANMESDIVTGGVSTIILTLSNITWESNVGDSPARTIPLLEGITGDGGLTGWDDVTLTMLADNSGLPYVTRLNDTVVAINIPAVPGYEIATDENINIFIDNQILNPGSDITASETLIIKAEMVLSLSGPTIDCYGDSTGIAIVTPSEGTPPYTYNWSNGSTDSTTTGLNAGWHYVTVTDGASNTKVDSIDILQPDMLVAAATAIDPSLYSFDGSIDLTITGGNSPYTFLWDNGLTTEDATGIGLVTNTVSITDSTGCTLDTAILVNSNLILLNSDTLYVHPTDNSPGMDWGGFGIVTDAKSLTNGAVNNAKIVNKLGINGGIPYAADLCDTLSAFGYDDWYLPAIDELNAMYDNQDFIGGFTDTYWASTEEDANGAWGNYFGNGIPGPGSKTNNEMVRCIRSSKSSLFSAFTDTVNITCYGDIDGAAIVTPAGGTPPYSYSWSSGSTDSTTAGLGAGWYYVTVSDNAAGSVIDSIEITQPDEILIDFTVTNINSLGGTNGAIDLAVLGGTPSYSYFWSNSETSEDLTGLTQGWYNVTISDANLCEVIDSIKLNEMGFPCPDADSVQDADGNWYATVQIGEQCWMAENINVGIMVNSVNSSLGNDSLLTQTDNTTIEKYCYNNIEDSCNVYGGLYQWEEMMNYQPSDIGMIGATQGICPEGWHLPTHHEWTTLEREVCSSGACDTEFPFDMSTSGLLGIDEATALKSTIGWSMSGNGSNSSGFTALPGGQRDSGEGLFYSAGYVSYFWTATVDASIWSWFRSLSSLNTEITRAGNNQISGHSVRCIKDIYIDMSLNFDTTNVDCFGASTGEATVTPTGGTPPYTYQWSSGSTDSTATGLSAGDYIVTVYDDAGGSAIDSIEITQPDEIYVSIIVYKELYNIEEAPFVLVGQYSSGSFIGPVGSIIDYGDGTASFLPDVAGLGMHDIVYSYTDIITGCSNDTTITVMVEEASGVIEHSNDTYNIYCYDETAGTLTANPLNSNGSPGTFSGAGTTDYGDGTATFDPMIAGAGYHTISYAYTGIDNITIFTITQELFVDSIQDLSITGLDDICENAASIIITGVPQYNSYEGDFSYDGTLGGITAQSNGTAMFQPQIAGAGTHNITYIYNSTWANSVCTKNVTLPITVLDYPTVSVLTGDATICEGTTTDLYVTISGGITPYDVTIDNGVGTINGYVSGSVIYLSPVSTTTFNLTSVFDANGCVSETISGTAVVTVEDNPVVDLGNDTTICFGNTLTLNAGVFESYIWNDGSSAATLEIDSTAYYSVEVTDINGCHGYDSIYVQILPSNIVLDIDTVAATCGNMANGSAVITATGGSGVYTYNWSNGDSVDSIVNVNSGTYSVTVTDTDGCYVSSDVIINQMGSEVFAEIELIQGVTCSYSTDGSLDVNATGGTGAYTYNWSNSESTQAIADLSPGNYSVVVTDDVGCEAVAYYNLNVSGSMFSVDIDIVSEISCGDPNSGSLSASVIGGAPDTYLWSNGSTTATINNIPAGAYNVTVTDVSTCTGTASTVLDEVNASFVFNKQTTPATCGQSDGNATITVVSGGTPPYAYNWSNVDTTQTADSLSSGVYLVTVTDANGCKGFSSVMVSDNSGPQVSTTLLQNVTCPGESTGIIDVEVSGGQPPYTYLWSTGSTYHGIFNLSEGMYEIQVLDANNCLTSVSYMIEEPDPIKVIPTIQNANCNASDGGISIDVIGGTPPYTYLWSTGGTEDTLADLMACAYYLTVTDSASCIINKTINVNDLNGPEINFGLITPASCGSGGGSINIDVTGGTSPYSFIWSNGSVAEDLIGVLPNNYTVSVTDSTGCKVIADTSIHGQVPHVSEICLITVDTLSGNNLVIWERPDDPRIDYYNIYRETTQSWVFDYIGSVSYNDLSVFEDTIANPVARPWRYKISMVDTCGVESPLSPMHKTLHLQVNIAVGSGINLNWDNYEGFDFLSYTIYRKIPSYDWDSLTTIPNNIHTYYDQDAPSDINVKYQLSILKEFACAPLDIGKAQGGPYSQSFSNMDDNGVPDVCIAYPVFTGDISGPATVNEGDNSTYIVEDITSGSDYSWTITNGSIISGQGSTQIEVNWTTAGNDIVSVTETNTEGCTGTSVNWDVTINTGIAELDLQNMIRIFPNPNNGLFNIVVDKGIKAKLHYEILNLEGQLIRKFNDVNTGEEQVLSIDLSILPKGVYMIRIVSDEFVKIEKIIVQ